MKRCNGEPSAWKLASKRATNPGAWLTFLQKSPEGFRVQRVPKALGAVSQQGYIIRLGI